jgi:hypothetical protein
VSINVLFETEGKPNMKISRNIILFISILAVGISAALILRAQEETATPVQNGTISSASANDDVSGLSDLDVELKAVEMTTPTPAAEVPQDGTFWSAQHAPGSAEEWPPLPGNWLSLPVWEVDTNLFLVDDLNYDYNAVAKTTLKARSGMGAMDLSPDDDGGSFSPMFSIADYSTNLWLEITNLSDSTAGLLVSNTVADIMYEVQSKANLTDTNWISEGFFFGSEITNWTPTSASATNYPTATEADCRTGGNCKISDTLALTRMPIPTVTAGTTCRNFRMELIRIHSIRRPRRKD